MSFVKYPVLEEAYDYYQNSSNDEFTVIPKDPEYLINVLNAIPTLLDNGFITDVSDNLLNSTTINIIPIEHMSFVITSDGIEYVRAGRDC